MDALFRPMFQAFSWPDEGVQLTNGITTELRGIEQVLGTRAFADDDDSILGHREASSTVVVVVETDLDP